MFNSADRIADIDPQLAQAIEAEKRRQEEHIELIASENYTSPRVLEAQGSVLTNKYAEGYPGRRYYGGCEHVDVAEQLAIASVRVCSMSSSPSVSVNQSSAVSRADSCSVLGMICVRKIVALQIISQTCSHLKSEHGGMY